MTKYAVRSFLKSRYGRIINISSIGGSPLVYQDRPIILQQRQRRWPWENPLAKEVGKKEHHGKQHLPRIYSNRTGGVIFPILW